MIARMNSSTNTSFNNNVKSSKSITRRLITQGQSCPLKYWIHPKSLSLCNWTSTTTWARTDWVYRLIKMKNEPFYVFTGPTNQGTLFCAMSITSFLTFMWRPHLALTVAVRTLWILKRASWSTRSSTERWAAAKYLCWISRPSKRRASDFTKATATRKNGSLKSRSPSRPF